MKKLMLDEIRGTIVGGKTIAEWDVEWEHLANAFTVDHPELRNVIGLFRIQLHGQTKYIVRATELKGGIAKGLKRISGPDQTGNQGYGANKIRENINQVTVEILRVYGVKDPSKVTKTLKAEMNKLYDPVWAMPFKLHMKMIHDGIIPPD